MPSTLIQNLKDRYKNGYDNIGKDLIGACLRECKLYRRGTAFFSGSALMSWADAMGHVIDGSVKIEIMCSPVVSDKHLIAILQENNTEEQKKKTIQKLADTIVLTAVGFEMNSDRRDFRSQLLAYLIATNTLEFRFAIPKNYDFPEEKSDDRNLYHVKMGYFVFDDDKVVAFEGSVNESDSAYQYNTESAQVFKSWVSEDSRRLKELVADVDSDWEGRNPFIEIYGLSDEALKLIKRLSPTQRPKNPKFESPPDKSEENAAPDGGGVLPPISVSSELRPYQREALELWKKNNFQGILEMATGTGKTRTAIEALKKFKDKVPAGLAVVTVPYQNLAEQWVAALNDAGLDSIKIYDNFNDWSKRLSNILLSSQLTKIKLPTLVVVEKTFNSEKFQEILGLLKKAKEKNHLIVADECHHFNKSNILKAIPDFFNFRLGLSATPYDQFSEHYLEEYFGSIVFTFNLRDAIENNFLTKYQYNYFPVALNDDESAQYNELTQKIISIAGGEEIFDPSVWPMVRPFLSKRSRIVAGCAEKLIVLQKHLSDKKPLPHTLFYCGTSNVEYEGDDVRQVEALSIMLNKLGWKTSRITADESLSTREHLLDMFSRKEIDGLISIKVLDEGIDIPACEGAYLLASQASDRQGIQRRGRVLRKSEGKEIAYLYDFLVLGGSNSSRTMINLAKKELRRAYNFSKDSINFNEIGPELIDLAKQSGFSLEVENE